MDVDAAVTRLRQDILPTLVPKYKKKPNFLLWHLQTWVHDESRTIDELKDLLLCPITCTPMYNSCFANDGFTYDMETLLNDSMLQSPFTRHPMGEVVYTNRPLDTLIQDLFPCDEETKAQQPFLHACHKTRCGRKNKFHLYPHTHLPRHNRSRRQQRPLRQGEQLLIFRRSFEVLRIMTGLSSLGFSR